MSGKASLGGSWSRKGKTNSSAGKDLVVGMRRQRSLEWRQERAYNSSSEEDMPAGPVDSHMFASLLAQAQKDFANDIKCSYRSDDAEDATSTDDRTSPFPPATQLPAGLSPRSPLPPFNRQVSPFSMEGGGPRRLHYPTAQDRLRGANDEVVYGSINKKPTLSNNTLTRTGGGRRHRLSGMTSSSSATSCNSERNDNILQLNGDVGGYHVEQQVRSLSVDVNEESPPEPAPPEIPPRGPSLHSTTLRSRRTEFTLPPSDVDSSTVVGQEGQFHSGGTGSWTKSDEPVGGGLTLIYSNGYEIKVMKNETPNFKGDDTDCRISLDKRSLARAKILRKSVYLFCAFLMFYFSCNPMFAG